MKTSAAIFISSSYFPHWVTGDKGGSESGSIEGAVEDSPDIRVLGFRELFSLDQLWPVYGAERLHRKCVSEEGVASKFYIVAMEAYHAAVTWLPYITGVFALTEKLAEKLR